MHILKCVNKHKVWKWLYEYEYNKKFEYHLYFVDQYIQVKKKVVISEIWFAGQWFPSFNVYKGQIYWDKWIHYQEFLCKRSVLRIQELAFLKSSQEM